MNNNFWYLFTQLISQLAQMHKKTDIAITEWEQHFDKLQHGLTFEENNPDVTDISENEICNKKLLQNDAGPSQKKSYNRYKKHSLDECAKNMVNKLRISQSMQLMILGKKRWTPNPKMIIFFYETFNTETQNKKNCQKMCLYNQKYIWDSDQKNIIDWGS